MGRTPTPKQLEFANAIVSGAAPSEAYRQAYRADGMSSASVAREAQRLLSNPVIAPIVEEGRREAAEAAKWSLIKALERLQQKPFRASCSRRPSAHSPARAGISPTETRK